MNRTILKTLAATAGLALALAGCGGDDKPAASAGGKTVVKIALWNYASTPEFKALIDGYEAENAGVDIQPVDILADDYSDKLTTMLAGGDTTDILTMKNVTDYARYANRGQLLPLTDEAGKLDKAKYSGLTDFDLKGEYFALPYRQDFWLLYYNKTMLKAAGVDPSKLTWSDYSAAAKKLTKGSGGSKVYGTYHHTWRSVVQAIAAAQTGGDLLSGDYGFLKDQYNVAVDLQKADAAMPWATASSQKISYRTMFSTSKTAMMPMGTWYIAGLLQDKKDGKPTPDWGIAPLPQVDQSGKVTTFGSPTAFAVNKKSKNADAAKQFVTWASGPKGAAAISKIGVVPSYSDDAILSSYFALAGMPQDEPAKKAFKPDTVKLEMPVSENSSDVDAILTEEHELVMVGEKSVDQGIAEMGKRVKSEVG
ncbi:sugar ABC transporter substrate-binding protein [Kribbella sp. NPDC023855]|uniref:ABC transporter substrate-binding protein n=1 Tax=Kribbella sp. NPDC023855 TaxID=3154698 RepID=UPI0033F39337